MSIRKMMSLHPKASGNQALGDAVHHLMYCAKMCASCADASMAETMDMTQCIRLCLDCSDICEATARLGLRQTGDDQPMLRELLELWGYEVEVAADGGRGVELALAHAPDVALIDVGLPVLDGYEVARRIRADPRAAACRLIALTGYGGADQKARALQAGFDLHLVKPVDPARLERLLAGAGAEGHAPGP